jgi:hypothetical protein
MDEDEEVNSHPQFLYSNQVYKWLDNALDYGITEQQFWDMTISELTRAFESAKRREQERATYDYVLADLIGRSIGRLYSTSNTLPDISKVYPALFDSKEIEEQKQAQLDELSALRFKQFAQSFNSRFNREVANVK